MTRAQAPPTRTSSSNSSDGGPQDIASREAWAPPTRTSSAQAECGPPRAGTGRQGRARTPPTRTSSSNSSQRQANREDAAAAFLARHGDAAIVALDDLAGAGQADAGAADAAFDVARSLEAFEDAIDVAGGDAEALVL